MKYEGKEWSDRLNEMADLKPGWEDGYGQAPSPESLNAADRILTQLQPLDRADRPGIFPFVERSETGDTGVAMEWYFERHSPYLVTVEISHDLHYEVYAFNLKADEATDFTLETDSCEEALKALRNVLEHVKKRTRKQQ